MSKNDRKTSKTDNKTNNSMSNFTLWPEWSDDKINTEKWNAPKGSANELFEDPHPPILPPSLKLHSWKRPGLISHSEPVLYTSSSNLPNLFINNQHIFHCQFIKWFISSLTTLYYHGKEGLIVTESSNFAWKLKNKPWRGWYHIYSLNKIEKKSQHNPSINPYGKYIVRLFFFGTWRSIEVDDLIPLDKEENPLLPRTENNQELWPILLAKAMLKIISMAWKSFEVMDKDKFNEPINVHLIYLLTGWTCLSLDISHLYPYDRWELLSKHIAKFIDSDILKDDIAVEKNDRASKSSLEDKDENKKTRKKSKGSNASIETLKRKKKDEDVNDSDVLTLLFFKNIGKNIEENGILSDYPIYAKFVSDVSLDPTQATSPTENWKRHRWFCWASQQGVMNPIDYTIPTRLLLLYTPFLYNHCQSQSSLHDDEQNSNQFFTWVDFNELSKCAMEVFFLLKTEKFKYSINISDTIETNLHQHNNDKTSFKNYYQYFHQPVGSINQYKSFRNEPLYFLIDSLEQKRIIFNFNVIPKIKKVSFLIVEKHCWFSRRLDEKSLLTIKTTMSSSKILSLGPGRHLLRIYVQSSDSYHLTIQCDTTFDVGNREEIQKLMTLESETSKIFTEKIKQCLISAFDAFGSENYQESLRVYYQSYLPEFKVFRKGEQSYTVDKKMSLTIHQSFEKALINSIRKKFSGDDSENILQSLRIFFINPTLGRNKLYFLEEAIENDELTSHQILLIEDYNKKMRSKESVSTVNKASAIKAAITIQSFWRMFTIKHYWHIHKLDSNEEKRKEIKKSLELIKIMLNQGLIYDIVRSFLKNKHELNDFYPIRNDFLYILNITKIKGTSSSFSDKLLPIFRLIVNAPENLTVFASLDFFIDLPNHYLRVFNNDTCREINKIINRVQPYHYSKNHDGYTIFSYGWDDSHDNGEDSHTSINKKKSLTTQKREFGWTLHIVSVKGDPGFIFVNDNESIPSLIEVPDLKIDEVSNNYVPNIYKKIFRVVVKTSSSCSIALRIILTHEETFMQINLLNSENKLLEDFSVKSGVIIPMIYLDKNNLYCIEALIMKDSWQLNEEELNSVFDVKKKKSFQYKSLNKINETAGVLIKNSDQGKLKMTEDKKDLEPPYWIFQVMRREDDILEIYEDPKYEIKMKELKESWFTRDPARLKKGKAMREAFVEKLVSEREDEVIIKVHELDI